MSCTEPHQYFTQPSSEPLRSSFYSLFPASVRKCSDEVASLQQAGCITSVSPICVRDQVWSRPIQGPCQSEAAVHTHPGAGERTPGLPAHAEPTHRRLHLRPLRCAARWASRTTEPAGELCQYLQCWILFKSGLKKNPIFYIHLYPSYIFDFICLYLFSKHKIFLSDTCYNIMSCMFIKPLA